jgi:hypothetical protein
MRKLIALAAALGLVASLGAAPAFAAKATKVHETFGATLAPFPNLSSHTGTAKPGCTAGEEGVHWVAQEFTSPGKGSLRFYAEGFTGDWDLYVFAGDVAIARSDQEQAGAAMAPPEEEVVLPLTKGQTVTLVACNWLGDPNVEAHYEGTFK